MAVSPVTFVFKNGVVTPVAETPPIATFLATHPGAYTTTRTHNNGEILLFYDRHLNRLSNSLRILLESKPSLIFGPKISTSLFSPQGIGFDSLIRHRVHDSLLNALPVALRARPEGEELAVSALVGGNVEELNGSVNEEVIERALDVFVHIGMFVPPVFGVEGNGARLAVVGKRREFAQAKYSDWARLRKPLEALRPLSATELLLSDKDGRILEGTITNFFVVCFKGTSDVLENGPPDDVRWHSYEIQTAPVNDGVLPGIIRQLVIEICLSKGITIREVSPSWLEHGTWDEAFITNSLRLVQHVETIQAPSSLASIGCCSGEEVSWEEKRFKAGPGMITAAIQREMMKKAGLEGFSLA